jgi:hypothetical protein
MPDSNRKIETGPGRRARLGLTVWALGCVLAGASCRPGGPDEARPWALVLAEASSPAEAAARAASLARERPELEGACGVSIEGPRRLPRHLVVGPPFASREEAEALSERLLQGARRRIEVLDFRSFARLREAAGSAGSAPAEAELFEQLAAFLPAPGQAELVSLLLLDRPAEAAHGPLAPVGWAAPRAWARALAALGFGALGQARYRLPGYGDGPGLEARVFVGLVEPGRTGDDGPDALRRVFNFLAEHARDPQAALQEAALDTAKAPKGLPGPKGRKAKNKKKKAREPRPGPPPPVVGPDGELGLVPVVRELPPAVRRVLPWGEAEVVELPGVAFERAARLGPQTRLRTAWLAWLPGQRGVALFLLDDPAAAEDWLLPRGLEGPSGLAFDPVLRSLWDRLPETPLPGDRLAFLGALGLAAWLPAALAGQAWAKPLAGREVLVAGYRGPQGAWSLACARCESEAEASVLFEQGLIQPRQDWLQTVMAGKGPTRYDVGVTLREVGDVEAWLLVGAAEGRALELYFRRRAEVWLLAGASGAGEQASRGLLARAETLPIWPLAVE